MAKSFVSTCARRLHGVAAVDEQRRALGQHDRGAGRAGEAGEPGEALLARRQVFVLLAIGARHDETVEAAPLEFGAQCGEMRGGAPRARCESSKVWKRASNMGRHSSVLRAA